MWSIAVFRARPRKNERGCRALGRESQHSCHAPPKEDYLPGYTGANVTQCSIKIILAKTEDDSVS